MVRLLWQLLACLPLALAIAPQVWTLTFHTTVQLGDGNIVLRIDRHLAPLGVDRLWELVETGYYGNNSFFRVVPGFVVQFGISGQPAISKYWDTRPILDDPVTSSNLRGTMAYATAGNNTRTTQLFINYADNPFLDARGFTPLGKVIAGMDIADHIFAKYAQTPVQDKIYELGNSYLEENFPQLDYITGTSYAVVNSTFAAPAIRIWGAVISTLLFVATIALIVVSVSCFIPDTVSTASVEVPLVPLLPEQGGESDDVAIMGASVSADSPVAAAEIPL